ncbi:hypothetical protein BB559_005335 [Furculomyces boomerangus]|uniref:Uncharacterized protein n=2 Tax=Harpellales TaxID=61421 RepID=A0A2T9Y978_9FUNG|nr:hypothetical protein BB559_005683 [Furculomyces boomerangus]PVU88876.1 hypothetical protein BB559_005335 [Furculomyces boomerangus]PVZ97568.1 hypothetical protein BB558_006468 [Smittium angustum]PVZ97759.1 hypothetical protein BB558_006271 [Smittium angustum]
MILAYLILFIQIAWSYECYYTQMDASICGGGAVGFWCNMDNKKILGRCNLKSGYCSFDSNHAIDFRGTSRKAYWSGRWEDMQYAGAAEGICYPIFYRHPPNAGCECY